MDDQLRANRYRQLLAPLDQLRAHDLLDKLQVLALTSPETLREFEAFIERERPAPAASGPRGPGDPGDNVETVENVERVASVESTEDGDAPDTPHSR